MYAVLPLHMMQLGCFSDPHDQPVTKEQLYRCARALPRILPCDLTLMLANLCSFSVGRSTAMSVLLLKKQEPVLKEPNVNFITPKNKARERKGRELHIKTTVEGVILVLFLLMFLNLG